MNQLSIDDSGDFNDEWPDGFFEEREEDLFDPQRICFRS